MCNERQRGASEIRWLSWAFPVAGLLALIWFLLRVVPKPARAAYPCQQVARPLAGGGSGLVGRTGGFIRGGSEGAGLAA